MFEELKVGAILYQIVSNDINATKVTKIESNDKGIYIYAESEKGGKYRFILIVYSTGKTHFGDSVFVRISDYMETV